MSEPIPLEELLADSEGGIVGKWDIARVEMARRLRKLKELCYHPLGDPMIASSHVMDILDGRDE